MIYACDEKPRNGDFVMSFGHPYVRDEAVGIVIDESKGHVEWSYPWKGGHYNDILEDAFDSTFGVYDVKKRDELIMAYIMDHTRVQSRTQVLFNIND